MKRCLLPACILLISSLAATAQTNATTPNPAPESPGATSAPAVHKPILFHAPSDATSGIMPIRVGGGSRGEKDDVPKLRLLVPDGKGITTQAAPNLYFYLSKPAQTSCEITVTEPRHAKPLFAQKTPVLKQSGILTIRLAKYGIEFKPGITYRWSVAMVLDPENRSQDVVVNGIIQRVEPAAELTAELAKASDADKAAVYAEHGIWYDALESISEQILKSPHDPGLRNERASLLKQVGIDSADLATSDSK